MRTLLVCSLWILLTSSASALPFVITTGSYFEGVPGGVRYDFAGENFSTRGTDTVGFGAVVNGVNYLRNDFALTTVDFGEAILFQQGNTTQRSFALEGRLMVGNPGVAPEFFSLVGAGLATLVELAPGLVNRSLEFSLTDFTAVPEPGTWLLLVSGLGFLLWRKEQTS